MSEWEAVKAENIVKHKSSGNYYLRAKVGGKIIRRTLSTGSLKVAKIKRDTMLADLRLRAGLWENAAEVTLENVLAMAMAHYAAIPSYQEKPASLKYREEIAIVIRRTLAAKPTEWSPDQMQAWWSSPEITRYSSNRRNNFLSTLRLMVKLLINKKIIQDDPTTLLRKARVESKEIQVPTHEEFLAIVKSIREQSKASSFEVANMVEFLAYCGCRVGECREVVWGDIDKESITITGGELGTKNHQRRKVPIIGPMEGLLSTMTRGGDCDPLFSLQSPRMALTAACERLNINHVRVHDLRHLFATVCIESSVDIPTVSRWLGHKDGGALAMRVYGHLRDEHSIEQAKRVKF